MGHIPITEATRTCMSLRVIHSSPDMILPLEDITGYQLQTEDIIGYQLQTWYIRSIARDAREYLRPTLVA